MRKVPERMHGVIDLGSSFEASSSGPIMRALVWSSKDTAIEAQIAGWRNHHAMYTVVRRAHGRAENADYRQAVYLAEEMLRRGVHGGLGTIYGCSCRARGAAVPASNGPHTAAGSRGPTARRVCMAAHEAAGRLDCSPGHLGASGGRPAHEMKWRPRNTGCMWRAAGGRLTVSSATV